MIHRSIARLAGAALAFAPAMLSAQTSQKVVTLGGSQYTVTAKSLVVAADNITSARHSTPISPAYNGVAAISIDSDRGSFICTGALLADGKSVLTAGHCVKGNIGNISRIRVVFYPPSGQVVITAASWDANPNYSGNYVIDENDVGVIHLASDAPAGVSRYDIAGPADLAENQAFRFVGHGARGSFGVGATLPPSFAVGNRKAGENLFDIKLGDARWAGFWDDPNDPNDHVNNVLFTDFDNGTTGFNSNDGMCWIGQYIPTLGATECNRGLGLNEANTAGGDSGGPGFINGKIASVTSFGLSFGQFGPGPYPDIDNSLNSSFGEYAGFTDVSYQYDWIQSEMDLASLDPTVAGPNVVAPEPGTNVLLATGLLGIVGVIRRRRRAA